MALVLFMQELIELSKQNPELPETMPNLVTFTDNSGKLISLYAGPGHFGKLVQDGYTVRKNTSYGWKISPIFCDAFILKVK